MMSRQQRKHETRENGPSHPAQPTQEEYSAFLAGVMLDSLNLELCNAELKPTPSLQSTGASGLARFDFKTEVKGVSEQHFTLSMRTTVRAERARRIVLKIELVHVVTYSSQHPPSDGVLRVFCDTSLPLQVWPYCREIVSDLTHKMGVPPLLLPVLVPSVVEPTEAEKKKAEG